MQYRELGRTGWNISEIGYGMWGMGGWTGSDDEESLRSLQHAVDLGCNFFDTAWGYGEGKSEGLLGTLIRANPGKKLYTASKIPPKNFKWPSLAEYGLENCYPSDHIEEFIYKSLKNFGLDSIDLMQFHTWDDSWTENDHWVSKMMDMKSQGLIHAIGISMNRWEPWNGIKAVKTGMIDSVQLIYNIFDQNPKDELLPACREMNVGVIARVPFDEGSLTGTLTKDSTWPEGDWRNSYFVPENLIPTIDRIEKLKPLVPEEMTLPEMALRFILSEQTISTVIPGMRKLHHVETNIAASDAGPPQRTAEEGIGSAPLGSSANEMVSVNQISVLRLCKEQAGREGACGNPANRSPDGPPDPLQEKMPSELTTIVKMEEIRKFVCTTGK